MFCACIIADLVLRGIIKAPPITVLRGIESPPVRRYLPRRKIIAAIVVPRKNTSCLPTLCIYTLPSRLHTMAPDVLGRHHAASCVVLTVLAVSVHKVTLNCEQGVCEGANVDAFFAIFLKNVIFLQSRLQKPSETPSQTWVPLRIGISAKIRSQPEPASSVYHCCCLLRAFFEHSLHHPANPSLLLRCLLN